MLAEKGPQIQNVVGFEFKTFRLILWPFSFLTACEKSQAADKNSNTCDRSFRLNNHLSRIFYFALFTLEFGEWGVGAGEKELFLKVLRKDAADSHVEKSR